MQRRSKTEKETLYRRKVFLFAEEKNNGKLDPVGSTVGYEMMKLCTGSVIGYSEAIAAGN